MTLPGALREALDLSVVRAVTWVLVGVPLVRLLARALSRRVGDAVGAHVGLVLNRVLVIAGSGLLGVAAARELGLDLTALLATAGVLTVAIGFAAQTSLSNLIAGLFLLLDKPFVVGDIVEIDGRVGVVESVTLMSTWLRTFENLRVRWPNEVVLKAMIVNYTRYPVRRIELKMRLLPGADLTRVRAAVLDAVGGLPRVLLDPPPEAVYKGITDGAVDLEIRAWFVPMEVQDGRHELTVAVHDVPVREGVTLAGAVAVAAPAVRKN